MKSTLTLAVAAVSVGGLLTGCGGGDDVASGTIEVTAVDYGFQGLPDTIRSGSSLTLENSSDEEIHELVALRIPDDEDRSVEELTELSEEEQMAIFGSAEPATVIVTPPGAPEGMAVVGDGSLDEPGRYAILCFIPTGADPDEFLAAAQDSDGPPDVDGGPPHFVNGMYAELTVVE